MLWQAGDIAYILHLEPVLEELQDKVKILIFKQKELIFFQGMESLRKIDNLEACPQSKNKIPSRGSDP
jgi:hypothetical protein